MKAPSPTDSKTNANQSVVQKKSEQESFFKPPESENCFFTKKTNLPALPHQIPLQRKKNESLPIDLQSNIEDAFGHDFSNVAIQKDSSRAAELNARAFTQAETIHFAPGEFNPGTESGKNLIGHELTHVVQQRNGVVKPTSVMSKGLYLNDDTGLEREADNLGQKAVKGESISRYRSAGLEIRNTLRSPVQAKSNVIQRDIKDTSKGLTNGKMELDFTKNDATAKGGVASETGTVKFTPNATAPNSSNIRLIQIVKVTDTTGISTTANDPWNYAGGAEGDRDNVRTTADSKKNIAGGFFIDHSAAIANPRTKKSDATVSPYYRDYWPNTANSQDGYKKSKTDIQMASLWDGPGHSAPVKYNFVTSAKAVGSTSMYYGSALWGFEIYLDKGVAKIKDEYKSFRNYEGETTDAAVAKFNEFYKNPGTSGAPTK